MIKLTEKEYIKLFQDTVLTAVKYCTYTYKLVFDYKKALKMSLRRAKMEGYIKEKEGGDDG